ncbi:MAG: HAMP domain-containing sensor histidine kinase [bacterium]
MFERARLTLAASYAAALALTLAGIGAVSYFLIRDDLHSEVDRSLSSANDQLRALNVAALPASTPKPDDHSGDGDGDGEKDDGHETSSDDPAVLAVISTDVFYFTFDASGAVTSNPRGANLDGVDLAALAGSDGISQVHADSGDYRLLVTKSDDGSYLGIGRSLRLVNHQLATLRWVFLGGGLVGLVVALGSGFWLAGRTLGPIRRSLESQRQFVSDASHELRTPLAIAKANSSMLLDDPELTIESRLDQAEAVAAELDHLSVLVGDLTTLARADEGRANLMLEPLDLGAVTDDVVRDMGALAEVTGRRLTSEVHHVNVQGDRARLRQLLVILIDNSLKYAPEGGSVIVRCGSEGGRAELTVTDDGPGIPAEDQKRIFERFYRVDSERTRGKGGTGLGLAIGKWICEAHGGRIAVESQPGQGTTFHVRLPLK